MTNYAATAGATRATGRDSPAARSRGKLWAQPPSFSPVNTWGLFADSWALFANSSAIDEEKRLLLGS